ncbi:MAG: hypothetical protein GX640_06955 [Fibrobacter sp.]|nr:hypothetical protein [Fibrobacter sp.]
MESQIKKFESIKAFLVNSDCFRQYIKTAITFLSFEEFELFIKFPDKSIYNGTLLSSNRFDYKSINDTCSDDYTLFFKCFWNSSRLLLSGNWQRRDAHGEIFIHASLQ